MPKSTTSVVSAAKYLAKEKRFLLIGTTGLFVVFTLFTAPLFSTISFTQGFMDLVNYNSSYLPQQASAQEETADQETEPEGGQALTPPDDQPPIDLPPTSGPTLPPPPPPEDQDAVPEGGQQATPTTTSNATDDTADERELPQYINETAGGMGVDSRLLRGNGTDGNASAIVTDEIMTDTLETDSDEVELPANVIVTDAVPKVSDGIYRIPYADDTEVGVTKDHTNHYSGDVITARIDMIGINGGSQYRVSAADDGIIKYIVDNNTARCGYDVQPSGPSEQVAGFDCSDYNNYVWIEHPNGEWTKYTHLETNSVTKDAELSEGDSVTAGTFLGFESDIGQAPYKHLHFEVGVPTDPSDPIYEKGGFIKGVNRIPLICGPPNFNFDAGSIYTAKGCGGVITTNPPEPPEPPEGGSFDAGPQQPQRCIDDLGNEHIATIHGFGILEGTNGADVIVGSNGFDQIYANGGVDIICGRGGDDWINGGSGDDYYITGEDGDDIIRGGPGDDYIYGGTGRDQLAGDGEEDVLYGESGGDLLDGGEIEPDNVNYGGDGFDNCINAIANHDCEEDTGGFPPIPFP
jgi:Ca2+-binding RTX toxin-like protein